MNACVIVISIRHGLLAAFVFQQSRPRHKLSLIALNEPQVAIILLTFKKVRSMGEFYKVQQNSCSDEETLRERDTVQQAGCTFCIVHLSHIPHGNQFGLILSRHRPTEPLAHGRTVCTHPCCWLIRLYHPQRQQNVRVTFCIFMESHCVDFSAANFLIYFLPLF